MSNNHWLIGIDGGGSNCRVRICDSLGTTLAEGSAGSANVRLGPQKVFDSINQAMNRALESANLTRSILQSSYVVAGLAGAVSQSLEQSILDYPHPFKHLHLTSDAVIACLGAHNAEPGAILILGTGSCAIINRGPEFTDNSQFQTIGGWGLTISDQGSGAKLGLDLVRTAVSAFEGITNQSPLTRLFMQRFDNDLSAVLHWSDRAKPGDFAQLVPLIIAQYQASDPIAASLINKSLAEVRLLINRAIKLGAKKLCLMGGYANFIEPQLKSEFDEYIVAAQGDALTGAITLAQAKVMRETK